MPLWNVLSPVKGSCRQPYPSETRYCVVSSGKQSFPVFFCARTGSTKHPSSPAKTARKITLRLGCSLPCPARPHRFARTFCLPPSVCFLFMQANTQKDPAEGLLCRVLQILSAQPEEIQNPFQAASGGGCLHHHRFYRLGCRGRLRLCTLFMIDHLFQLVKAVAAFRCRSRFRVRSFCLFCSGSYFRFRRFWLFCFGRRFRLFFTALSLSMQTLLYLPSGAS